MNFKRFISNISALVFSLLIILAVSEISIRYFWGGPIQLNAKKWEKFDVDIDAVAGYKCKSGTNKYAVLNDTVEITCNDCGRVTSNIFDCFNRDKDSVIDFYGCSFTFGHGIADSLTFAWKLQKSLPDFIINNYGFEGYGLGQVYAQILQHMNDKSIPKIIIVNYAGFHDYRNMILKSPRRNAYYYQEDKTIMNQIKFPVLYLEDDKLIFEYKYIEYKPSLPLVDKLAFMNFLDVMITNISDKMKNPNLISIAAFENLNKKCNQKGVKLVINGIVDDAETQKTLQLLSKKGILTSDISIDLSNKSLLLKDEFHPNEIANDILAKEFNELILNLLK